MLALVLGTDLVLGGAPSRNQTWRSVVHKSAPLGAFCVCSSLTDSAYVYIVNLIMGESNSESGYDSNN